MSWLFGKKPDASGGDKKTRPLTAAEEARQALDRRQQNPRPDVPVQAPALPVRQTTAGTVNFGGVQENAQSPVRRPEGPKPPQARTAPSFPSPSPGHESNRAGFLSAPPLAQRPLLPDEPRRRDLPTERFSDTRQGYGSEPGSRDWESDPEPSELRGGLRPEYAQTGIKPDQRRTPAAAPAPVAPAPGPTGLGPRPQTSQPLSPGRRANVQRYFGPPRRTWPWVLLGLVTLIAIWGGLVQFYNAMSYAIRTEQSIWDAIYDNFPGVTLILGSLIVALCVWRVTRRGQAMSDREVQALIDHDLEWPAIKRRARELSCVDPSVLLNSGFKEQALWGHGDAYFANGEFSGVRHGYDNVRRFTPLGASVINASAKQFYIYSVDIDLTTGNWLHERSVEMQLHDVVSVRLEDINLTRNAPLPGILGLLLYWLAPMGWIHWIEQGNPMWLLNLWRNRRENGESRTVEGREDETREVNRIVQTSYARRLAITGKDGQVIYVAVPGKGALMPGIPAEETPEDPGLSVMHALRKYVRDLKPA